MSKLYFKENQKFTQIWLWLIILGTVGLFVFMDIKQLVYHQPVGDHPMSNDGLLVVSLGPLVMVLLFLLLQMETEIRKEGVYFRFRPFQWKFKLIRWEDIEKAYVRKYRPLVEFGGWGIRFGLPKFGRAYNVRGNMGLQLELRNRRKILLGTQKPDELERALNNLKKDSEQIEREL